MKRPLGTLGLFQFLTDELSAPCIAYNTTLFRVFNSLPSDSKLDVYLNDELLAKDLGYKQFSYYIPILETDIHSIKIFISGGNGSPVIDKLIQIHQSSAETLAIVGTIENPSILDIRGEPTHQPYPDNSLVRYANLSQNNVIVNVILNNNIIQSGPIDINNYNKYSLLDPTMYTFNFVLNNSPNDISQTSATHILKPTRMYTFYLVGSLDTQSQVYSSYPLELVISVDISTLIKKCPEDMKRL